MKTQEAYNQYQLYAQSQYQYYEALTWVLFTIFVIAPILMAIIYISVALYMRHKGTL